MARKEDIRKVISEYFAAIRAMDAGAWVATFAEDAVSHDPVGNPPIRGREALDQFFNGIAAAFQRLNLTEDQIFIAGNGAAVKWTGRGVGKNSREIFFEGIDVFDITEQGKIQTVWAYWDMAAMLAQLQGTSPQM
ncbi:MAG: nuclear transport factor 2 family protein [Acidobacteria bacterium]|nr:nuclear transport factor 2 family protein [Acidobacteriota bacterium]